MPKELIYQPLKWEKELKRKEKVWKQLNGQNAAYHNLQALIQRNEKRTSLERRYQGIYSSTQLEYKIIADNTYLRNTEDNDCIKYVYLSGISGVFSYLFDTPELQKQRDTTEMKNAIKDFAFSLLQLYAVNQPIPSYLQKMDHLYVKLLMGDFEKVNFLLLETETEFDPGNPDKLWIDAVERAVIRALINKDEDTLKKALITRIREYRKWPVGYSTFIDVFSIALIKLARQYGMNCEIDVIEIPKFFFDKEVCSIDTENVKPPFFEDAVEELKKMGIDWTL